METEGHQRRPTKEDKFLLLQPSANSPEDLFRDGVEFNRQLGRGLLGRGLQGRAHTSLPGKSNHNVKRTREREAPGCTNGGHPEPLLWALNPPSPVGLLSVARHAKCHS